MSESSTAIEARALEISKWTNLAMGVAGGLAAWLSGSQALMVDGLFSLIGFGAAVIGARVATGASRPPDRLMPFGYAADEALFTTFRSLSLIALVVFSLVNAGIVVTRYILSGEANDLNFGPILIYFVTMLITCAALTWVHQNAWKQTGMQSNVLKLERDAAIFNGLITLAAGVGLMIIPFLGGTPLEPLQPIGDSVIVMLLCTMVIGLYFKEFRSGVGELRGITAPPETIRKTNKLIRAELGEDAKGVVDVAVTKLGRTHTVGIFFNPGKPVTGKEIDGLTERLVPPLQELLGLVYVIVIVSERDRAFSGEKPGSNGVAGAVPSE